jgi:ABC-type uncharacterized transport system permease subunit
MREIAIKLPGGYGVANPPGFKFYNSDAGAVISSAIELVIYISAFLMFFWLIWGVFQYIFAGGDKEQLARARKRITWAIIGFFIVLLAFTISRFLGDIFQPAVNPVAQ